MPESPGLGSGQIDDLLGLPTRGRLTADLQSLAAEADRQHPLSFLFIDLDQFKQVNDFYSHEAGDEVLQKIASGIKAVSYGKGQPYRYGGDEFVVLLPNHSLREAASVSERIRENTLKTKFEHCPERITASIGLTSYPEPTGELDALLQIADAAMYAAKDLGGNAVRGPGAESLGGSGFMDESVRVIRSDIASKVESVELWMTLQQANHRSYSILFESDNDDDVIIEGVTLRKGTLYLCRFDKPKKPGDWVVPAHSRKQISGDFASDPVGTLIYKDASLPSGVAIEIDIVVRARILGRLRSLYHTILATVNYRNRRFEQFSP